MNNDVKEESRCALNYSDVKYILENRILNDSIVNALQKMLNKQFTEANWLQKANFQVCRSILFVQVLHNGMMHWVAISTYGCDQGEIYLMVSLFNGRIAEHTKKQICSTLNCAAAKNHSKCFTSTTTVKLG